MALRVGFVGILVALVAYGAAQAPAPPPGGPPPGGTGGEGVDPPPGGGTGGGTGGGGVDPPPDGGTGGGTGGEGVDPPPDGGTGGTGDTGGNAGCTNPTCSSPPCAAALLGDVGCTSVAGAETYNHEMLSAGDIIASGAHIFGPFEAGFTERNDNIIESWGCSDASVAYDRDGGKDIDIAEAFVAHACNLQLPRIEGNTYYGIVGPCGGHTGDYHFHRSLNCLYAASGGHSTKVGDVASYGMYGKWEDYSLGRLPLLDACGAHIGPTPESSTPVYHYHVQDTAPFTVGCHGPSATGGLVSVATCRSLYNDCDNDGGAGSSIVTGAGSITYDLFCPCFDATGSNMGTNIQERPALSSSEIYYVEGATTATTTTVTTTTSGDSTTASSITTPSGGTTASSGSTASSGTTASSITAPSGGTSASTSTADGGGDVATTTTTATSVATTSPAEAEGGGSPTSSTSSAGRTFPTLEGLEGEPSSTSSAGRTFTSGSQHCGSFVGFFSAAVCFLHVRWLLVA